MASRSPIYRPRSPLHAATDPVESLDVAVPVRPERGRSLPLEQWQDQLRKRKPRNTSRQKSPLPGREQSHQIDDYA